MASKIIIVSETIKELLEVVKAIRYVDVPTDTHMDMLIMSDIIEVTNIILSERNELAFNTLEEVSIHCELEDDETEAYLALIRELSEVNVLLKHISLLDGTGAIVLHF